MQALVFSAAEYSTLVLGRSCQIKKLDTILNNTLHTISGCLHATPLNQLLILASISTPSLLREATVLALSQTATNYEDHFLDLTIIKTQKLTWLKSWRSFSDHENDPSKNQWLNQAWTEEWKAAEPSRLQWFVDELGELLDGDLSRKQWTTLLADLLIQWEVWESKTLLRMIEATPDKLGTTPSSPAQDIVYPTTNCAYETGWRHKRMIDYYWTAVKTIIT